ncbi:hypothetical protein E3N88_34628 [Mikania micrantha]|uniref:Uncharacterized protein n=1 Tax=Mikania micrantha TaxID=192012 RepID=A0A5N6LYT9_9ASTR|nr:hypothetical protein E3N88_34628 [Mikania micrantha]
MKMSWRMEEARMVLWSSELLVRMRHMVGEWLALRMSQGRMVTHEWGWPAYGGGRMGVLRLAKATGHSAHLGASFGRTRLCLGHSHLKVPGGFEVIISEL